MPSPEFIFKLSGAEREAALFELNAFVYKEVVPAMLARFPDFDIVVDDLSAYQDLMFVNMTRGKRGVICWNFIEKGSFNVSVGEIILDRRKNSRSGFEIAGRRYRRGNSHAVWYESERRENKFGDDHEKRSQMVTQAIDEVDAYLIDFGKMGEIF